MVYILWKISYIGIFSKLTLFSKQKKSKMYIGKSLDGWFVHAWWWLST